MQAETVTVRREDLRTLMDAFDQVVGQAIESAGCVRIDISDKMIDRLRAAAQQGTTDDK